MRVCSGGISGRPVKFTYYDDASTAATDVQLVNQIIAKNVPVILGPSLAGSCNAASPVVANGPVLYCFSPGIHPDKGSYTFTSSDLDDRSEPRAVHVLQVEGPDQDRHAHLDRCDRSGRRQRDQDGRVRGVRASSSWRRNTSTRPM